MHNTSQFIEVDTSTEPEPEQTVPEPRPEPRPEWEAAKNTWGWGWQLHTYGLGTLHVLLAVYAFLILLYLNRRLKVQLYILAINTIMVVLGLTKGVYLLMDPYGSTGKLPASLEKVFYGLTFPCLTSAFSLLQILILRITKVRLGAQKASSHRVLYGMLVAHFAIVILIYLLVSVKSNLKLLMMLSQAIFITWGLILCFIFIYNGFKIAQFTNETSRVLKQIVTYSKVKKEVLKSGNQRDLALHRITKTKVKNDSDAKFGSEASIDSGAESSDTLSFYNDAPLEMEEDKLAKLFQERCYLKSSRRKRSHPNHRENNNSAVKVEIHRLNRHGIIMSSESDYVTDTPSTNGVLSNMEEHQPKLQNGFIKDGIFSISANKHKYQSIPPTLSEPTISCSQTITINSHINPAFDLSSEPQTDGTCTNGSASENAPLFQEENETEVGGQKLEKTSDDGHEGGYMADTELPSPKRKKNSKNRNSGFWLNDCDEEEANDRSGSPCHCPYPLPISDGSLGLYRIRQGRVLRKVLKMTYFTTLFAFICCVLQLYAMFGVYGVLSNEEVPEPWPWYIFHTCSRLGEFGVGCTITWITYALGSQRNRPHRRRKKKAGLENQTMC